MLLTARKREIEDIKVGQEKNRENQPCMFE